MALNVTDLPPTDSRASKAFAASSRTKTLLLPRAGVCDQYISNFVLAHSNGDLKAVEAALNRLAVRLAKVYRVEPPMVRIKGVRPHHYAGGRLADELWGTCTLNGSITIWVKTAHRKRPASPRTLLSTFWHEYCHHLDVWKLGFVLSLHTVGFYERVALLYHRLLRERVVPLIWVALGDDRFFMQLAKPGRAKRKLSRWTRSSSGASADRGGS